MMDWIEEKVCEQAFLFQMDSKRQSFGEEEIRLPLFNNLKAQGRPVSMELLEKTLRQACLNDRLVKVGQGRFSHPAFCYGERVKAFTKSFGEKQSTEVDTMEFEVKKQIEVEEGKHTGKITKVEYRTDPYAYTDIFIQLDDVDLEIKYGCPSNLSLVSKRGKVRNYA